MNVVSGSFQGGRMGDLWVYAATLAMKTVLTDTLTQFLWCRWWWWGLCGRGTTLISCCFVKQDMTSSNLKAVFLSSSRDSSSCLYLVREGRRKERKRLSSFPTSSDPSPTQNIKGFILTCSPPIKCPLTQPLQWSQLATHISQGKLPLLLPDSLGWDRKQRSPPQRSAPCVRPLPSDILSTLWTKADCPFAESLPGPLPSLVGTGHLWLTFTARTCPFGVSFLNSLFCLGCSSSDIRKFWI